jgi:molecular chaperone GrpE
VDEQRQRPRDTAVNGDGRDGERGDRDGQEGVAAPAPAGAPAVAGSEAAPAGSAPDDPNRERLLRAYADIDNLRKRFQREVVRERADERARVVSEWLPLVDDLQRALDHAGADPGALVEGIQAMLDRALAVLVRQGFPRFDATGEPFDPARHEAVGAAAGDAPPGTVLAVVRPGYGTDDAVLRPAAVVVSKGG